MNVNLDLTFFNRLATADPLSQFGAFPTPWAEQLDTILTIRQNQGGHMNASPLRIF